MAARTAPPVQSFLDQLRARHRARLPGERGYEAMMYAARSPPTAHSLAALRHYLATERPDARTTDAPHGDGLERLGDVLAGVVWPDPAPVAAAARLLPGWNTIAVTTLLHTQIPDYPLFGAREQAGLARLGQRIPHEDDPQRADSAYGAMIEAVKRLRELARHDQVPESHHFLTRIVQAGLEELGAEG